MNNNKFNKRKYIVFLINFLFFCKILLKNFKKIEIMEKSTNFKKSGYNTNASDAMLYCVGCVIKRKKE